MGQFQGYLQRPSEAQRDVQKTFRLHAVDHLTSGACAHFPHGLTGAFATENHHRLLLQCACSRFLPFPWSPHSIREPERAVSKHVCPDAFSFNRDFKVPMCCWEGSDFRKPLKNCMTRLCFLTHTDQKAVPLNWRTVHLLSGPGSCQPPAEPDLSFRLPGLRRPALCLSIYCLCCT